MEKQNLIAGDNNCSAIFELSISSNYPDKYWVNYDSSSTLDYSIFVEGKRIERCNITPEFSINGKLSEKRFFDYDFLFSGNGPNLVSPKFTNLIKTYFNNEVQLFEAILRVNGRDVSGYHVINITERLSCMDKQLSEYRPLLSYLPDGPIKINNLVISKNKLKPLGIFRLEEEDTTILVSSNFVKLCESAEIKGISFEEVSVR